MTLVFNHQAKGGHYMEMGGKGRSFTRKTLIDLASKGKFLGTFTAGLGTGVDFNHPQPALWTPGPIHPQRGRQKFPVLRDGATSMTISGRHIQKGAQVVVDGRRVPGSIKINRDVVTIALADFPDEGMHLLQVQNPGGLFSNDFIFYASNTPRSAPKKKPAPKTTQPKKKSPQPAPKTTGADARTETGARLRKLVKAGKLTGEEAIELFRIAFPESDSKRRGDNK